MPILFQAIKRALGTAMNRMSSRWQAQHQAQLEAVPSFLNRDRESSAGPLLKSGPVRAPISIWTTDGHAYLMSDGGVIRVRAQRKVR